MILRCCMGEETLAFISKKTPQGTFNRPDFLNITLSVGVLYTLFIHLAPGIDVSKKPPKTMYLVCKTVTLFEDFVFHYIQTWEGFTLCISCIVQWQNVCLALLLLSLANAHSLKEKTNGFKPNGPFEVTSTSFKGSSFTLPPRPPHPSAQERL